MQTLHQDRYIGIDVGGTSAKFALVSSDGVLTHKGTFPTGENCSTDTLLERLTSCIERLCDAARGINVRGIGLCLPGVVEADGLVHGGAPNLPSICDVPFGKSLKARFHLPVSVLNDANAAALGEAAFGAGAEHRSFLFVAYGTGIGGALVLDGRLYAGAHGYAGELGYTDASGENCAETSLSAIALMRAAACAIGWEAIDGVTLFDQLRRGDAALQPVYADWLAGNARMLANAVALVDVPLLVVGGGISGAGTFLTDALQRCMDEKLPAELRGGCRILPAQLGNDAALFGAVNAFSTETRRSGTHAPVLP